MFGHSDISSEPSGGRACTETKPDEACRWLPCPQHAYRAEAKKASSHGNRHLPGLCEALDVSRTEL